MPTMPQKLQDDLSDLIPRLAAHIAGDAELRGKMDAMYKILVTGNGDIPLPEQVRIHSSWIEAHDAIAKEIQNQKNELDKERRLFKRQIYALFIGQAIMIVVFLLKLK